MQAALTAAERGHEVILCEKSDRLGGVLRCEEKVPFKRLLSQYLDQQAGMIRRAPIDVRLGTSVTPELAEAVEADVVLAALGARPCVPGIPGIHGPNVLGAEEAYLSPERTGDGGDSVVVLGGGLVGIELAVFLAGLGRDVTIMEMMETLSDGGNPVQGLALMKEIKRLGIKVSTSTRASEVDEEGCHRGVRGERLYAAAMPHGATGGAAVEQLRQGRARRHRGGEQDAVRRRYRRLRDGATAAPGRSGRVCASAHPSSIRSGTAGDRGTWWRPRAWPLPSRATCERPRRRGGCHEFVRI